MKILCVDVNKWERPYIESFAKDHEVFIYEESLSLEMMKEHSDVEIISVFIYSKLSRETLRQFPHLRMIATRSTGYDHIDLEYCKEHNVTVCNVPFYGENTVAEHTFALILALSRNIHKSYLRTRANDFSIDGLIGFDLMGKTMGVIGAGHIGQHVIRIAKGFGMKVLAYDTHEDISLSEVLGFTYTDIPKLLQESDIVTLHVPYNKHTHHLIDEKALSMMKSGALLINTSRGAVVDTEALLRYLEKGVLGGVGLDVIEGEEMILEEKQMLYEHHEKQLQTLAKDMILMHKENVVYTPHIAFFSQEAVARIICTTLENVTAFCEGKGKNIVNN